MKEEAHKKILDRENPRKQVQEHFKDSLELLQEVTNYGTNLIPRCFVSSKRTLPGCYHSWSIKHAVAMLDSIEINISQAAVLASHVPTRILFETYLYISWLLKSDTDLRAKQYYVWDLRQRRLWANRTVPGTPENLSIQTMLKDHSYPIDLSREEHIVEDARKQLKSIDAILKQPVFKPINDQFDKLKKRDFDEHWYAPSGVRSLRRIPRKLDVLPEYTILMQASRMLFTPKQFKNISPLKGMELFFNLSGILNPSQWFSIQV